MKKLLLLLALTSTPALAASPLAHRFSVELSGTANLALHDIANDSMTAGLKVHTAGADITGVYTRSEHHAFTLRLSYAAGEASESALYDGAVAYDVAGKLSSVSLMPGYRYTTRLSKRVQAFAGANLGMLCHEAEERESLGSTQEIRTRDKALGLAYSLELGLVYTRWEKWSCFVGYRFSGSTAQPQLSWSDGEAAYSVKLNAQRYHSLTAGVRRQF